MNGAMKTILAAALGWSGVTSGPHRFGGVEFRLGTRELGYLHGDRLLDVPFPLPERNELIADGRADAHHVAPQIGRVSFRIKTHRDVDEAVELLRMSYDIAVAALGSKPRDGGAATTLGAGESERTKEKQ